MDQVRGRGQGQRRGRGEDSSSGKKRSNKAFVSGFSYSATFFLHWSSLVKIILGQKKTTHAVIRCLLAFYGAYYNYSINKWHRYIKDG
jgi:hypothetical protein